MTTSKQVPWSEKKSYRSFRIGVGWIGPKRSLVSLTGLYNVRIILPVFFRVDLFPSVCAHQEVSDPGRSDSSVDMATWQSSIGNGTLIWFLYVGSTPPPSLQFLWRGPILLIFTFHCYWVGCLIYMLWFPVVAALAGSRKCALGFAVCFRVWSASGNQCLKRPTLNRSARYGTKMVQKK